MERLGAAIAAAGDGPPPALLLASAESFEDVAIEFGQDTTDELVEALGRRLEAGTPAGDSIARIGDHHFAILCTGGEREGLRRADSLQHAVQLPFQVEDRRIVVALAIGIAASSAATAESMVRDARIALRRARERGGGRPELHTPELATRTTRRLAIEDELRVGLERGEFELFYQPLISLPDGDIEGFEALLRWNHPQRGLVPPGEFLPVAEESGLIVEIGRWALREACRQAARWSDDPTLHEVYVSVNVSGSQLADPGFDEEVRTILAQTGVAARRLVIELTETVLMEKAAAPSAIVQRLRDLGVRVALDDFGTGYSSLAYLRSFPVQMLKIDRSFIAEALSCPTAGQILKSIAELASTLGLSMVVEGVETAEQAAHITELGCPIAQGYLFSRPVSAQAAGRILREGLGKDVLAALHTYPDVAVPAVPPPGGEVRARGGRVLTLSEACRALGVSVNTLRRWADSGRIESIRTAGGHRRFPDRAIRKINRERGHRPTVRPTAPPRVPIHSAASALGEVGSHALARAVASLYADTTPGWLASAPAMAWLDEWLDALRATCTSGDPRPVELSTHRLIRAATLAGTTVLERDLFVERFFELIVRALAARQTADDDLRHLRRLARSLRQRALAQAGTAE